MDINAQFRDKSLSPTDFANVLARMGNVIESIAAKQSGLSKNNWHLKGNSKEEASLYPAFDHEEPSMAALAVLKEEFRQSPDQTYVSIWVSDEATQSGASMTCHIGPVGERNSFTIEMIGEHGLDDLHVMTGIVSSVVQEFAPADVEVAPMEYVEKHVFDDKLGVGWMLYLPETITAQQVPEARALIPIPEKGKKQTGTIIVSVTDGPFSIENPEHVETANRIEIRLVDQDLLPKYIDL